MKAIIVDIEGRLAVAMSSRGEFIKINSDGSFKIGDEIDTARYSRVNVTALARVASLAAVFLVIIGLGLGVYGYSQPYTYVDIDINPSIEITANVFDRIIAVEGINADGEVLLSEDKYEHKKLEEGVKQVLKAAVKKGYFPDGEENAVLITLSTESQEKAELMQERLKDTVQSRLEESGVESEVLLGNSTLQERKKARELGLSPGKLSIVKELMEDAPEFKIEDLKDMPVKDIRKNIKNIKKYSKEQIKENRKEDSKEDSKLENDTGSNNDKKDKRNSESLEDKNEVSDSEREFPGNNGSKGNSDKSKEESDDKEKHDDEDTRGNFEDNKKGNDKASDKAKEKDKTDSVKSSKGKK